MKTDLELLYAAAKAGGIEVELCTCKDPKWPLKVVSGHGTRGHWSSLSSGADALSLAAKLGLTIQIDLVDDLTRILNDCDGVICVELHGSSGAYPATRRAITRAAATLEP